MSLTMSTGTEGRLDSERQWAVETHGLTKRFGCRRSPKFAVFAHRNSR